MKGKNSAGDDFPIMPFLGISLLDFTGDNLPESIGVNSSNSTGDNFLYSAGGDNTFQW